MNKTLIFNISRQELFKFIVEKENIDPKNVLFSKLSSTGLKIGVKK